MASVTLKNASDCFVAEAFPKRARPKTRKLWVQQGGSNRRYAFIFFSRPFPLGATITSAKLTLYNGVAVNGSATLTLRRISGKWARNRTNWDNQPPVAGTAVTVSKSGSPPPGTPWEIDVTSIMQSVSQGGAWFGFRVTANDGANFWLHASESFPRLRPTLEVTWSDAPEPPEELSPDGNRAVGVSRPTLRFSFTDYGGDTDMAACHIQLSTTTSFLNPLWDSGEVPASEPEFNLSTSTFDGVGSGQSVYWRVRVKDGAGIWSQWSDRAQFRYLPKAVVTLHNPPDIDDSYVQDATPPILWSFPGQVAYQVIVSPADERSRWLWNSGKITGNDSGLTLPSKILRQVGTLYNVRVRCWDNEDREAVPGSPAFAHVNRDFELQYDPNTAPVTNLEMGQDATRPWALLTWSRGTAADSFEIWRNDELIASVDAEDALVSGTSYSYLDKLAHPRQSHTWEVKAVANGKGSKNNPTVTGSTRIVTTMIMARDGSRIVTFLNAETNAAQQMVTGLHEIAGDAPPVLITQSVRGYEGTVTGVIANEAIPASARTQRERFKRYKRNQGEPFLLYLVDEVIEVVGYNFSYVPKAYNGGVRYIASFDFFQTDF